MTSGCSSVVRVRTASGSSQGNLLLKTCFHRRNCGVAERDLTCQAKESTKHSPIAHYSSLTHYAGVAQLLERFLAKEEVES